MKKECLYTLKKQYRDDLNIYGYRFGRGEKAACIVGSIRGNEVQQLYICSQLVKALKRLEEKGFLVCEKAGKTNSYRPLVVWEDYQSQESQSILRKLYAGSLKRFAAALYDGGALTGADVDELQAYLDTLKEG